MYGGKLGFWFCVNCGLLFQRYLTLSVLTSSFKILLLCNLKNFGFEKKKLKNIFDCSTTCWQSCHFWCQRYRQSAVPILKVSLLSLLLLYIRLQCKLYGKLTIKAGAISIWSLPPLVLGATLWCGIVQCKLK